MKSKVVDSIVYEGLGFPIKLCGVEMLYINGEWHPKIDVKKVADLAIEALASQEQRFTGDQIRFIRKYFSMSLRDFAEKIVQESHTTVHKWEKKGEKTTGMDINIEKMLKLYIYAEVCVRTKEQKKDFYNKFFEFKELNFKDKQDNKFPHHRIQIHAV